MQTRRAATRLPPGALRHVRSRPGIGNDKTRAAIFGFNLFFAEIIKFQLNTNRYDYLATTARQPAQRSLNELLAQCQFCCRPESALHLSGTVASVLEVMNRD